MSTETEDKTDATTEQNTPVVANERPKNAPTSRGHGPMGAMGGAVAEKAVSFGPSLKRLVGYLSPQKVAVSIVIVMAAIGVTFNVLGPKVMGKATDIIFAGVVGKNLPAGVPIATIIAQLRASGQANLADMLAKMNVTPGQGIRTFVGCTVTGQINFYPLPFVPTDETTAPGAMQAVTLYADPGTGLEVNVFRSGSSGEERDYVSVSGYLVDVP